MIIAIDGPAASGKSTLARALAEHLGLPFLDTGAMYRAVTLAVQARGVSPQDAEGCARVAHELELAFDAQGWIRIHGEPGEPRIRSAEVTRDVSAVSAHAGVRAEIVPKQRELAHVRGAVVEGRDTTTVVFPDADWKFFLAASCGERARRRATELGQAERAGEIELELERRDHLDSSRDHSPLREAEDAIRIETDGLDSREVLELVLSHVRAPAPGTAAPKS